MLAKNRAIVQCATMRKRITIMKGALVQPHELAVAEILTQAGENVVFLPVSGTHSADILFRGREWEIKSPKGSSSRTIENNMRLALQQSSNIIIDLSRIKIREDKCMTTIKNRAKKLGKKRKVMIITKEKAIIELQRLDNKQKFDIMKILRGTALLHSGSEASFFCAEGSAQESSGKISLTGVEEKILDREEQSRGAAKIVQFYMKNVLDKHITLMYYRGTKVI